MTNFIAKNNSDYIYYSKVNESAMESSKENGSTKRKYTKKIAANPENIPYDLAKSGKSHSLRVGRNS